MVVVNDPLADYKPIAVSRIAAPDQMARTIMSARFPSLCPPRYGLASSPAMQSWPANWPT
jgi:hypothetical protein